MFHLCIYGYIYNLLHSYLSSDHEDEEKLSEFYMHISILKDMNFQDPNSRLEDMQLMALASWLKNEETRDEEVKRVMTKE